MKARKTFVRTNRSTSRKARKIVKPDFVAQLKETWRNRVFFAKEVTARRSAELEGEEGWYEWFSNSGLTGAK
jgi:hypothetical protein